MDRCFLAFVIAIIGFLAGCSTVDLKKFQTTEPGTSYSMLGPQIELFELRDPYGTAHIAKPLSEKTMGRIRLNRFINSGKFNIGWKIRGNDPYVIDLMVGPDSNINNAIVFYATSCTYTGGCGRSVSAPCFFTPNMLMYCGYQSLQNPAFYAADIGKNIESLPVQMRIFLRACDSNRNHCDIKNVEVTGE